MNYSLYQNGAVRIYSPRKSRDWSARLDKVSESVRRIDDILVPFVLVALYLIVLFKLYG